MTYHGEKVHICPQCLPVLIHKPAHRVLYNERFDVFKQVYRQMKGVYRRMNS
jgi:hypothetical protein